MKSKKEFTSVDEYIGTFPEDVQIILDEVRAIIKSIVPDAKEKISYQIAAFELNGKNLIHYAGWKNHISMYPVPEGTAAFNKEMANYVDGKGTIKFPLDKPMPMELIGKINRLHLAENLKKTKGD